jgi:hypothetical protein
MIVDVSAHFKQPVGTKAGPHGRVSGIRVIKLTLFQ